jgi:hypothetical protein
MIEEVVNKLSEQSRTDLKHLKEVFSVLIIENSWKLRIDFDWVKKWTEPALELVKSSRKIYDERLSN